MASLAHALLGGGENVLASWAHRYERSGKRGPGARPARHHAAMVRGMIEALVVPAGEAPAGLAPGSAAVRDLEKTAAFAGAHWSADGATGFEIAAIMAALRDAVLEHAELDAAGPIGELFDWLQVLALDGYATAGRRAVAEKAAEELEAGTPVLLLTPEIPAVLLVGAPTTDALDGILARAMLLVVRVGAPTLLLDVSGLADAGAAPIGASIARLFEHRRMGTVELAVIGASPEVTLRWRRGAESHSVATSWFERFDDALAHAARRAGIALGRRS